jgi:deoxyribodipyrimidine photolyase-related protein
MSNLKTLVLVLGNQLFDPGLMKKRMKARSDFTVFMREDRELCTYFRFHKQKIIFFLAAMRAFRQELQELKIKVHYEELPGSTQSDSFEESLSDFISKNKIGRICFFEIEDKFFEARLIKLFSELGLETEIWPSPMFLTSRDKFNNYLQSSKRPFMKTFYERQRKDLQILVDGQGSPLGGQWSFDEDNRKSLPRDHFPPPLPSPKPSPDLVSVVRLTEKLFPDHPGDAGPFWLPVDRSSARLWLKEFIKSRLALFGPYEDALPAHSDFLYHSVLTPFLNTGLLTPEEVVEAALEAGRKNKVELSSLEGFIRQVIGWREFIRGIYRHYSEEQDSTNFWNHQMKLTDVWYRGGTGIPPLDRSLERVQKHGYLHHIERLMVVGNLMLLLEVQPREAHRWFMEMFIDSSDWVMGPNVYGMALFSDGGIFATKPYICGSNYLRKMGGDPQGPWCDAIDGLYWGFIQKHEKFFLKNPRLSMMARALKKIEPARLKRILLAADEFKGRLVQPT